MRKHIQFLLLTAALAFAAQESAPTFRVGTKLVEVDVVAHIGNHPAEGLTQDDFSLLDNGAPRRISVFSVRSARSPTTPAVPLPAGAVSNRVNRNGEAPASATIILLDRVNTPMPAQRFANAKVVKFLEKRGNKDRIGIYTLGLGLRVIQELTEDPNKLTRAANALKPQDTRQRIDDTTGMSEHEMEGYARAAMMDHVKATKKALQAIARHLAQVPGRKTLIWITGSFPIHTQFDDFTPDMKEAARALNEANVVLYPVDARGLVYGTRQSYGLNIPGIDTLNLTAGLTGGRARYADNGLDDLMREAIEDSEITYTLGFYPSQEEAKESWHNLRVSVAKRGVSVRYRKQYFSGQSATDANRPTLNQLVLNPIDAGEIGIFAQATQDSSSPRTYHVRVGIDLHDIQLSPQDGRFVGSVNLSFFLEGSPTAQTLTRTIEIPEKELAAKLETGADINIAVDLKEPTGSLRAIVQDAATGAAGSLKIPLGGD